MIQTNNGQFYIGVVEDRNDPLQIGRVKVRVVGLHFHDKTVLPTEDLPWAMLMQPATGGTGMSAVGPAEGTSVIVIFNDWPENQQPIVIGALGGVPQGNPVNVDKFEDTPLFKDDIAPAGRKIPVTAAEATANQTGPITGGQNTLLNSIVSQGQTQTQNTGFGAIQNILNATSQTMGAVGGLASAAGGVGSTYGIAKTAFEDLLLGSGNKDSAIQKFKVMAVQSGPLGSALSTIFNGNASLKSLGVSLGLSITNIQSSFKAIRNPRDLLGAIANAGQIAGQIGGAAKDLGGTLGAIYGEVSQVTLAGTVGGVVSDLGNLGTSILGELGGIAGAGLGQVQSAADILGLGNITGGAQAAINSILSSPAKVAEQINGAYSSQAAVSADVGNISILTTTPVGEADSTDFEDVEEGATPPVSGVYGGPNFGGAAPVLELPKQDMKKFEGGSKTAVKTSPPADWQGNRPRAEQGIKALIDACSKYGLSTNEQKAALLGIVGGECGWIPQDEIAQYSDPKRLCQIFPSTFKGKTDLAEKYCNWVKGRKGSPSDFFNFVYDPANNGRQLGNSQPGDGGKFYGRGFIQLTGRANYERYAKLSGHPIDKNPSLLSTDMTISAEIAVLYLMDRVKGAVPTAHPGYFYAAKKAVGNNSPDIAARKLKFYEHFYSLGAPESYGYAEKQAGNGQSPNSYNGALGGNESGKTNTVGFQDPHGKYPLKRSINEPETSRLARGQVKETIVALKQSQRSTGIELPLSAGSWSQPDIPFGAKYPYNRVMETESGHIQEWDDTPGYERTHTYHRSGTFEEIDANGTKVTKIVGDGYVLFDRNGYISIEGDANVTVAGNVNIYCRSDANIEVAGSAEMKVGGNFDIGVARDMNIAVQGNFSLWANGSMNLQAAGNGHILSKENLFVAANKQIHTQSTLETFIEAKTAVNVKATTVIAAQAGESIGMKAGTTFTADAGEDATIITGADAYITSGGTTNIKAGGDVALDGANVHLNTPGAAADGTAIEGDVPESIKALIHGMVPPPAGTPLYPVFEPFSSPAQLGEEQFMYEMPEDGQTGASKAYNEEQTAQQGKSNTFESEKAAAIGGAGTIIPSSKQSQILAMADFTADFRLSTHFTLGMMFDGGFNARHRLVDQNGLTKQQIVANLSALCENILERYLTVLPDGIQGYNKKWKINSGYRMGTTTSDHARGRAVDIGLIGGRERKQKHHELIQQLDKLVPYDQLILEYAGPDQTWIHTGFRGDGKVTFGGGVNRKMAFTMNDHKTHSQGFTLLA